MIPLKYGKFLKQPTEQNIHDGRLVLAQSQEDIIIHS